MCCSFDIYIQLWAQESRRKHTALVFKMRTRRNFKNCTIFHVLMSPPFVFSCVSVGSHLKSLCPATVWEVLALSEFQRGGLWACKSPLAKSPGWCDPQAEMLMALAESRSRRLLPCTRGQSSKQPKEHEGQKTSWCSSQATYQNKKVGVFLCSTECIITFYSFGNLPRTYSRGSKELTSPMCSGFQSSHIGKSYMSWASEKPLEAPAAWCIWAIGATELLIKCFTLRPVWHQELWLILCYQLISKLYSEVKCCDS